MKSEKDRIKEETLGIVKGRRNEQMNNRKK